MGQNQKLIKKGNIEPISKIPFHTDAPLKRFSMLSKKIIPDANTHVAVHIVDANKNEMPEYTKIHKHNADEINLILSEDNKLTYEIQLDDKVHTVSSPSSVFIPKGTSHKAKAVSGKGTFVCIILANNYKTTKG